MPSQESRIGTILIPALLGAGICLVVVQMLREDCGEDVRLSRRIEALESRMPSQGDNRLGGGANDSNDRGSVIGEERKPALPVPPSAPQPADGGPSPIPAPAPPDVSSDAASEIKRQLTASIKDSTRRPGALVLLSVLIGLDLAAGNTQAATLTIREWEDKLHLLQWESATLRMLIANSEGKPEEVRRYSYLVIASTEAPEHERVGAMAMVARSFTTEGRNSEAINEYESLIRKFSESADPFVHQSVASAKVLVAMLKRAQDQEGGK